MAGLFPQQHDCALTPFTAYFGVTQHLTIKLLFTKKSPNGQHKIAKSMTSKGTSAPLPVNAE